MRKRKQQKMESIVNPLHHEAEIKANLTNLPDEVLLMIFSFLSKSDLVSLSQTCQGLKHVARDPSLWTELILKYEAIRKSTWACRELVSRCTKLKHLTIIERVRPDIDNAKVMSVVVKRKDTLTYLKIDNDKGLSNSAMTQLSKMTNLRHLAMSAFKLEPSGLLLLTNLTELQEFLILPSSFDPRPKITPFPFTAIEDFAASMKQLKTLKIPGLSVGQVTALMTNITHLERVGNWTYIRIYWPRRTVQYKVK